MASIATTRTAAAAISTNFGMAQFPRLLVPWPSVHLTVGAPCITAVWLVA